MAVIISVAIILQAVFQGGLWSCYVRSSSQISPHSSHINIETNTHTLLGFFFVVRNRSSFKLPQVIGVCDSHVCYMRVKDRKRMSWKPRSSSCSRSKIGLGSSVLVPPSFTKIKGLHPHALLLGWLLHLLALCIYVCWLISPSWLAASTPGSLCASPFNLTWSTSWVGFLRQKHVTGVHPSPMAVFGGHPSLVQSSGHLCFDPSLRLCFGSKGLWENSFS